MRGEGKNDKGLIYCSPCSVFGSCVYVSHIVLKTCCYSVDSRYCFSDTNMQHYLRVEIVTLLRVLKKHITSVRPFPSCLAYFLHFLFSTSQAFTLSRFAVSLSFLNFQCSVPSLALLRFAISPFLPYFLMSSSFRHPPSFYYIISPFSSLFSNIQSLPSTFLVLLYAPFLPYFVMFSP